jgi:hypothetical protein
MHNNELLQQGWEYSRTRIGSAGIEANDLGLVQIGCHVNGMKLDPSLFPIVEVHNHSSSFSPSLAL